MIKKTLKRLKQFFCAHFWHPLSRVELVDRVIYIDVCAHCGKERSRGGPDMTYVDRQLLKNEGEP